MPAILARNDAAKARPPAVVVGDDGFVVVRGRGAQTRPLVGRGRSVDRYLGVPFETDRKLVVDVVDEDGEVLEYALDGAWGRGPLDRVPDGLGTVVSSIGVLFGLAAVLLVVYSPLSVPYAMGSRWPVEATTKLFGAVEREAAAGTAGFAYKSYGAEEPGIEAARRIMRDVRGETR